MKLYLVILLSIVDIQILKSQTLEYGAGFNLTILPENNSNIASIHLRSKPGISAYYRYTNPGSSIFLKNNLLGLDYSRAGININMRMSSGGAGGNNIEVDYSALSLTLNNYFMNFKTLKNPDSLQFAMGLHLNYKLLSHAKGYYRVQNNIRNSAGAFGYDTYDFKGYNISEINKFNLGLCLSVSKKHKWGKCDISLRYAFDLALRSEVDTHKMLGFSYFRQTLGIYLMKNCCKPVNTH